MAEVGKGRNEVLSGRTGSLGVSGGSPFQLLWWVAGKSHLVISDVQRSVGAGDYGVLGKVVGGKGACPQRPDRCFGEGSWEWERLWGTRERERGLIPKPLTQSPKFMLCQ